MFFTRLALLCSLGMTNLAFGGWEETVARITERHRALTPAQLELWVTQYAQVCPRSARDELCGLDECTAGLPHCQPGRLLLFRGEPRLSNQPAVAALLRAHLQGATYSPTGTEVGLLEQLRTDLARFRPTYAITDSDTLFLEIDAFGQRRWRTEEGGDEYRGYPRSRYSTQALDLAEILFSIHLMNLPFSSRDSRVGTYRLDPFVSFSFSPRVARSFAQPPAGSAGPTRVIVASVARSNLQRRNDPENMPQPGEWTSYLSTMGSWGPYSDEREIDAVLYPPADDIVGSVTLP